MSEHYEVKKENYFISTDNSKLNVDMIHNFLSEESYWAKGIPRAVVEKSIINSLCFGVYCNDEQVGFARLVTDKATFAYLSDVYVLPEHRGKGLARRLMEEIMQHVDLQGLRRMLLTTRDAHALYAEFGFRPLATPERMMEVHNPHAYGGFKPAP